MPKQLTAQTATITTAAVQVQTLTISGKQVTLAVFRQLRQEQLIAHDGTLNGVPWGTVNYHPDRCGDSDTHWHIVWQRGDELLRAWVNPTADFDQICHITGKPLSSNTFKPELANNVLNWRVYSWLMGERDHSPLRQRDKRAHKRYYDETRTLGEPQGFPVEGTASEKATTAAELHAQLTEARRLATHYASAGYGADAEKAEATLQGATAELGIELKESGTTLEESLHALSAATRAEADRRHRHRDLRKTLADLPQLFIAV